MRIAFFALFAQLSYVLGSFLRDRDLPNEEDVYGYENFGLDPNSPEPSEFLNIIEMLRNAKRLGSGKINQGQFLSNRKARRDFDLCRSCNRPGVDYFRKSDYDGFFSEDFSSEDYSQDKRWVEEVAQKEAA
ncbi:hypothetical protein PNEG_04309, partial [Pneumocystis murina B123]